MAVGEAAGGEKEWRNKFKFNSIERCEIVIRINEKREGKSQQTTPALRDALSVPEVTRRNIHYNLMNAAVNDAFPQDKMYDDSQKEHQMPQARSDQQAFCCGPFGDVVRILTALSTCFASYL
jgi:hypothetical protein